MANELSIFPPEFIVLVPDDDLCRYVGWTEQGDQFFLTTPFTTEAEHGASREFVACFIFESDGRIKEAIIHSLGSRGSLVGLEFSQCLPGNIFDETEQHIRIINMHLSSFGVIRYESISVRPFAVEKFGIQFGLIPEFPEDENEEGAITAEPGNYMAFSAPWDGRYDT